MADGGRKTITVGKKKKLLRKNERGPDRTGRRVKASVSFLNSRMGREILEFSEDAFIDFQHEGNACLCCCRSGMRMHHCRIPMVHGDTAMVCCHTSIPWYAGMPAAGMLPCQHTVPLHCHGAVAARKHGALLTSTHKRFPAPRNGATDSRLGFLL